MKFLVLKGSFLCVLASIHGSCRPHWSSCCSRSCVETPWPRPQAPSPPLPLIPWPPAATTAPETWRRGSEGSPWAAATPARAPRVICPPRPWFQGRRAEEREGTNKHTGSRKQGAGGGWFGGSHQLREGMSYKRVLKKIHLTLLQGVKEERTIERREREREREREGQHISLTWFSFWLVKHSKTLPQHPRSLFVSTNQKEGREQKKKEDKSTAKVRRNVHRSAKCSNFGIHW